MKSFCRLLALIALVTSSAALPVLAAPDAAPMPREVKLPAKAAVKPAAKAPPKTELKVQKTGGAADGAKIRFPMVAEPPTPPPPMPVPVPKLIEVPVLKSDNLYVVDSDVELLVVDSPEGSLKVSFMDGPVTIRSKFIDGERVETRTYKGKFVYLVEGARDGAAELLVFPLGGKPSDLIRKKIVVQTGVTPPKPPDPPKPPPDVDPLPITGFRVIFIYETSPSPKYTAEQNNILNSTAISTYLNSKCVKSAKGQPEWRRWDKDIKAEDMKKETDTLQKLWVATKPKLTTLPAMVVVNDTTGEVIPLPATATEADVLATLKKYGGN